MPTYRRTPPLTLTEDDRRLLEQVRDSRTEEIRRVERARIILAYADGSSVPRVARMMAVTQPTVYRSSGRRWPLARWPRSKT
jgi:hypothetical protein